MPTCAISVVIGSGGFGEFGEFGEYFQNAASAKVVLRVYWPLCHLVS